MKLKWGESKSKYISKKIPTAKRDNSWLFWYLLFIAGVSGVVYLIITQIIIK